MSFINQSKYYESQARFRVKKKEKKILFHTTSEQAFLYANVKYHDKLPKNLLEKLCASQMFQLIKVM